MPNRGIAIGFVAICVRPAIERLRPEFLLLGQCVDQLHLEIQVIAVAQDRGLNHRVDVEFSRNLWNGLLGVFVTHRRGPVYHVEAADLA